MNERPETMYASAHDGVSVAYQVTGQGPLELLFFQPPAIPLDLLWDDPGFVHFARRLRGFSQTVWLEARGGGSSGGLIPGFDSDEAVHYGDITAVLDKAACERVVLVASGDGGPLAISYATLHPERVSALVLIDSYAHYVQEEGYPWGLSRDTLDQHVAAVREAWGTGASVDVMAPSKTRDEAFRSWLARCQRFGLPRDAMTAWRDNIQRDVRHLLPALSVPTLVLHREGDRYVRIGAGRYLADHIPGANFIELPGEDHYFFVGDSDALLDEIEEFLTGTHQGVEGDVVMAAILFTDIVGSTEQSAGMGHRKWGALTDQHDAMVRAALARHRGREIRSMGDGFLATFDATTRAIRAAREIVAAAKGIGIQVRAGVHTGEVEFRNDDVAGLTVNIARRICDLAGAGEVFVSEGVRGHLVGSGIATPERGTHVLKGVPDEWRLFAIES
ncbi:MAG TPA: adenylate/guanylate cyclase domain-containing protein [Acidimicrobiales bacterium]|nr:adenylate/guanylate cyclase domain-containing protein [Acidimicrobiales bacterium]